nr:MAG TPA: hypothetical protein [Caudoviricetes sp.]
MVVAADNRIVFQLSARKPPSFLNMRFTSSLLWSPFCGILITRRELCL